MAKDFIRELLVGVGLTARPDLVTTVVSDHPDPERILPGLLFVVTNGKLRKWACFRCPCGCGEKIMLSLVENRRPRWTVITDWLGRPTISPSVNRLDGCRSHFLVQKGRVAWCPNGRPS